MLIKNCQAIQKSFIDIDIYDFCSRSRFSPGIFKTQNDRQSEAIKQIKLSCCHKLMVMISSLDSLKAVKSVAGLFNNDLKIVISSRAKQRP